MEKRLLNVKEAALYIGSTPGTMYQRVHDGSIPFVKIGRSVRFDKLDLDAFIEQKKSESMN
jgi:excisionase family DNA binding protein